MTAPDLLRLVVEVRERSGRPLDADGLQRMREKIWSLSQGEATRERAALRRLIDADNGVKRPNRNRP